MVARGHDACFKESAMRKTKLAFKSETIRVLSSDALSRVAGGAGTIRNSIKPCTFVESGCIATLTGNCQTQFCEPILTEGCGGDGNSIDVCY